MKIEDGGTEILDEGGYFDITTLDAGNNVRREIILTLEKLVSELYLLLDRVGYEGLERVVSLCTQLDRYSGRTAVTLHMFNVTIFHSEWVYFKGLIPYNIPFCWGWGLVRNPRGGSIATIASTAFSYESPDINRGEGGIEWLDIHFFETYAKGYDILGEVWARTIDAFLDNFTIDWDDASEKGSALIAKNVEEWLLIGDPSLKIGGYADFSD